MLIPPDLGRSNLLSFSGAFATLFPIANSWDMAGVEGMLMKKEDPAENALKAIESWIAPFEEVKKERVYGFSSYVG